MSNQLKREFFDEIIDSLRSCEEDSAATYVAKDVLLEFYRPAPKIKQAVKRSAANSSPIPKAPPAQVSVQPVIPVHIQENTAKNIVSENTEKIIPAAEKKVDSFTGMGKLVQEMSFPELKEAVSICSKCPLCRTRTNTVFGDGNEETSLMFIGEGPGAKEDAQGLPFVGDAGELLTKMIQAMGFARSEVYIGNIVKCRPPGNRTPEDEEISACLPYIKQQIDLIKPKAIVLLGATPLKGLFNMTGITKMRGKFLDYNGIPAMPTFHPAFLLRNPAAKADVWKDLQMVMKLLGKEIPKKKNQ